MNREELVAHIFSRQSYLSVGLDTDLSLIPAHLQKNDDAVFEFNKQIIDATREYCVAYKINTAFYEAEGVQGWDCMQRTVAYIGDQHFIIADAKRGDIGNTSAQYAKAFFQTIPFAAITVAPYMGQDSVRPFLDVAGKWTILLGLTSNPGAEDFELQKIMLEKHILEEGVHTMNTTKKFLYEHVLETASTWGTANNLMFVVGATQPEAFENIRRLIPDHFLLVPGVGAQGGSLEEISKKAMTKDCGLLVNASRAIIYASGAKDFASAAGQAAKAYQQEMKTYLKS